MGQYKVIQDIEAEDKLVGPFSLRQFIYAFIVVVLGIIAFRLSKASILLTLPFLPPMIFFGALAAPLGGVQSSEIWLLAKISFFLKPRRRIWNQDGIQELVTITVPKKIEKQLTDNLSQHEVKSRLSALANTLDSRGWAVRGAINQNPVFSSNNGADDRLLAVDTTSPDPNSMTTDDIMDETTSPVARQFQTLLDKSGHSYKQQIISKINEKKPSAQSKQAADYWFMSNNPADPKGEKTKTVLPGMEAKTQVDDKGQQEQQFLQKRHQEAAHPNQQNAHLMTLQPLGHAKHAAPKKKPSPQRQAEIARLADNDDLNISTIAREAKKTEGHFGDDEVVVKLHQ